MKKYDVIGLMSGTSLDGLDIAFVEFIYDNEWFFNIKQCQAIGYDDKMSTSLIQANELSGLELKHLDIQYGKWIGNEVKKFMDFYHILPDLIVSHGHTIFHQPEIGLTHQIGDGYEILKATGIKTICDLRSLDISLGGQGAPLVPVGDKYLFSDYDICLNLGGFSNVSFDINGERIAYDVCPTNTVLNHLAQKVNLDYDNNGDLARSGKTNAQILRRLNALNFYNQHPPKSLGIEWVQKHIFPMLTGDSPENLLNTFCHHITHQIISSLENNGGISKKSDPPNMLITGGGAQNSFLVSLLRKESRGKLNINIPDKQLIDFKEALIFAFLGLLRNLGEINTFKSVTGAKSDSSGGLIYDNM